MVVGAVEEVDPAALVETDVVGLVVGMVAEVLVGLVEPDVPAGLLEPLVDARFDDPVAAFDLCVIRFLVRRRRWAFV